MSLAQSAQSTWDRWVKAAEVYRDRRQLIIMLMGYSSGMPFLLTSAVLSYWMTRVGVDLTTIGIFVLVGTPYAFKFVWAPLVDQLPLPGLDGWLGRRRSWMLLAQAGVLVSTLALAWSDPVQTPWFTAAAALAIAFFSATQDIAVDAYRIEILNDDEQGAGSATTQLGYRIALWIVDAMALLLPSILPWPLVLSAIATLIIVGIVTTFCAVEPTADRPVIASTGAWVNQAVVRPFAEFLAYRGWVVILLFALLYKYGDALGGSMARPFYVALGFTGPEIFGVTKSFGVAATILGGLAGGIVVARYGLFKALLVGGILQAMTNLLFSWQAAAGHDIVVLTIAISADNFTGSLGSIAFVAYLSSLCTSGMAGTQYALLTSLMAFGRTTLSAGGGWLAATIGWPAFWLATTLLAVPGLLLLLWLWRLAQKDTPPSTRKEG
ncbi:AmpG family muropeptide MFS transporter [Reyranella sp.]|uniref:AmpG family muropeptide MFS transporter n=1 Tax=Reyranella sp. TaxID=1929291 RepID=UPI003784C89C